MKIKFLKEIDIFPTSLFLIASVIWRTHYYNLGLYVLLPLMIVFSFHKYYRKIVSSKYWRPYLFMFIWMWLSSSVSGNAIESYNKMIPVSATFLLSFSIQSLAENKKNTGILSLAFICLFISILYFTITGESYVSDFNYSNETERRANTDLNNNQYAYFSLFAIMGTRLMLGNKVLKRPLLRAILYLLLIVIAFYTALLTASRQVLLLEIPLIFFFLYYDYWIPGMIKHRLIIISFFAVAVFFLVPQMYSVYENSYLAIRASGEFEEDARYHLMWMGIQQGIENPLLGVGLGAKTFFSHCTYTHLFSRCGLPTLLLFMYIIITSVISQYSRYRETGDQYFLMYFFLLVIFAMGNFLYSYIDQPFMMPVLFLVVGDSNKLYYSKLHN